MKRVNVNGEFSLASDSIRDRYVEELKLSPARDLPAFVRRWRDVIEWGEGPIGPTRKVDWNDVRNCIRQNRKGVCQHAGLGKVCLGSRLMLPKLMIDCQLVVQTYKVPFNLALVRVLESHGQEAE